MRADDETGIHGVLSRVVRFYYSCSVVCELGTLVYCNSEISCETANFFLSRCRKSGGASRYRRTVSYTGQHSAGIGDTYPCPEWDAKNRKSRNLVVQYCAHLTL